jgi:uncharacterized protein YkwD
MRKNDLIPFKCPFCNLYFCSEHRLPENHGCPNTPERAPLGSASAHKDPWSLTKSKDIKQKPQLPLLKKKEGAQKKSGEFLSEGAFHFVRNSERRNTRHKKALATILIVAALIAIVASVVFLNNPFSASHNTVSPSTSPFPTPSPTQLSITTTPTATPTAAPTTEEQQDLVNYALSLINTDRQANGLQNVTLSNIDSGQEHADDMLKNGYFSHWDLNGYKPYMRYTLAGGQGAVAENDAWQPDYPYFGLEQSIKNMEWQMMYNDSAENWGHRDNILNPLHNEVSIGIAYDSNDVYFVEDFINNYISWSQLSVNGNKVTMQGNIQGQSFNIRQIDVFFDNPSPLTVNQLNNPPYQDGYTAGTYTAIVVPPASSGHYYNWTGISQQGIVADSWNQNGNSLQITFSLSKAIAAYGNGIYTLYLETSSSTADSLTTYSIWIS